jgi:hypothetical protein
VPELDHPEKFFPIILLLVFIWIVLYMRKLGERKMESGTSYLGSASHLKSMGETIEDVARRVIGKYPTLDDGEQARMVRDELRLMGILKVDMYEATIFTTIARLKGNQPPPPPSLPRPPPPSQPA